MLGLSPIEALRTLPNPHYMRMSGNHASCLKGRLCAALVLPCTSSDLRTVQVSETYVHDKLKCCLHANVIFESTTVVQENQTPLSQGAVTGNATNLLMRLCSSNNIDAALIRALASCPRMLVTFERREPSSKQSQSQP